VDVVFRQVDALIAAQQRPLAGRHLADQQQWNDEEGQHEDGGRRRVQRALGGPGPVPRPLGPIMWGGTPCLVASLVGTSTRDNVCRRVAPLLHDRRVPWVAIAAG